MWGCPDKNTSKVFLECEAPVGFASVMRANSFRRESEAFIESKQKV